MNTTKLNVRFLEGTRIAFQKEDHRRNKLLYNFTQIGYVIYDDNCSISRAGYDAFALFFVNKGKFTLDWGGKTYAAAEGDLIFYDQSCPYTLKVDEHCSEAYFVYLFGNNVRQFWNRFYKKFQCMLHGYDPSLLREAVEKITPTVISGTEDPYQSSLLLYNVLVDLLRYCEQEDQETDIAQAVEYINIHYAENFRLKDAAKIAYMSQYSFIRQFHARTGYTPNEYRNNIRFNKAKELLKNTDLSVSRIAIRLGFSDSRGLIALFQRKIGISPSAFRDQAK